MVAIVRTPVRKLQHPLIQQLANCIESQWQHYLNLASYDMPENLGYVEGYLAEEKLIIENRCYQTTHFRKLHLELARVGDRLDILHCVMFPHYQYDLPIFGVDLVGSKAGIGAAIVDLSPVNERRVLTPIYEQILGKLPQIDFTQPRELPNWGNIFSQFCLFVQPKNSREEQLFLDRVHHYLTIHCELALATLPVDSWTHQSEIMAGQRYYCAQQQQNDKTRRVLEKSLGKTWTDNYMTTMLFDCP